MTKASDLLRPDNRELFETVRDKLNQRSPVVPVQFIADELGVTVDELCRWFIAYKEPRKAKAYQSPRFPALPEPKQPIRDPWADSEERRRQAIWKRQHEAARAAREAMSD
jgi:hypothetical protein